MTFDADLDERAGVDVHPAGVGPSRSWSAVSHSLRRRGRMILVSTAADWLAPDALVVGYLTIRNDGLAFQTVVPNSARAFDVGIERIERFDLPSSRVGTSSAIEIVVRGGAPLLFLVPDRRVCALALEQAIGLSAARGVYR
ncbi:MAG: hypothetical protein BGO98_38715 [Myxococcales bacterium 68-20]|nr:MAG: hypothetical protein BGO98_38715 [Myxococcales bacterium 68-20]